MSLYPILRRHRALALASVAVIGLSIGGQSLLQPGPAEAANAPVVSQARGFISFADVVAADKPAVVTITTTHHMQQTMQNGMPQFEPGSPMDQFFRQFFGDGGPMQPGIPGGRNGERPGPAPQEMALGSGFIVDSTGIIITNNHVIDGADKISVTLDDGTELPAKLIGRDAKTDLAVIKVESDKPLPVVQWGDSNALRVGDPVLAIGNPFGVGTTATSGIVSARGRDLHNSPYDDFIQIDAAINHGNSGGPLVDDTGKVVGINSAIYSPNGGNVGVGFAIPSSEAKQIVARLIKDGSIEHGFIGVSIQPVTDDVANAIGLDKPAGALVAAVSGNSPASSAGVETGDVITAFNGKPVDTPKALSRDVADVAPGQKATLTIWRHNKSQDLKITIGRNGEDTQTADNSGSATPDAQPGVDVAELGLGLSNITPDVRQSYNLADDEHGVLVESVKPDTAAADQGIRQGDVVVAINQTDVMTAADARDAIDQAAKAGRKSVLLLVDRAGTRTFIALPMKAA